MNDAGLCPSCGASVAGASPCPSCGSPLAGTVEIAMEPLRQEAMLAFDLLASASLHPVFTYQDEEEVPHPIDPGEPFTNSAGLLVPVVTTFAVYVPAAEADEARRVLEDARHALDADAERLETGGAYQNDSRARSPRPEGVD